MKKLKMLVCVILMVIIALSISSVPVLARQVEGIDGAGASGVGSGDGIIDPILNPDLWKPDVSGDETLSEKIGAILGAIQVIGVLVSVIVLMVIGIKYMVGSAEEKAINKKAMIPYLVGAFMVFSVTTLPNFIYQVTESAFCEHKDQAESRYYSINIGNSELHELGYVCNDCGVIVSTGQTASHRWGLNASQDVYCTDCGYIPSGNASCTHTNLGSSSMYVEKGDYQVEYKICNECHTKVKVDIICYTHDLGDAEDWEKVDDLYEGHYTYRMCNRCERIVNAGIEQHVYKLNGFTDENPGVICIYCGYTTTGDLSCGHNEVYDEIQYEDRGNQHIGYQVCKECKGKVKVEGLTAEHTFEAAYENVNHDNYHNVGKRCTGCELFVKEGTETHDYKMEGFTDEDYKWYCRYCKYAPTTGKIDCEHTDLKTDEINQIGSTYYVICRECEGKVKVDPTDILYPNN